MSESTRRHIAILNMLPQGGEGISTSDIEKNLRAKNFRVSTRMVQRDMNELSADFPLVDQNVGRAKHWSFMAECHDILIPNMSLNTALILKMAEQHLMPLIPMQVRDFLQQYFPAAEKVLQNHQYRLKNWVDTTRSISMGLHQRPPEIDSEVFEQLSQGIVNGQKCEVQYQSHQSKTAKSYRISPLAMVIRGPVTYLLAVYDGYNDIRQMALHRFSSARTLADDGDRPQDFDLDVYIRQGHFGILNDPEPKLLELTVSEQMMRILQEAPLAEDQQLIPLEQGGRVLVSLPENQDLYRWLLSHSNDVRVESPAVIRDQLIEQLSASLQQYDACPA